MMNYLITGATGSLGTALISRLIAIFEADRIVCFSRDEYKQAQLAVKYPDHHLRWFLGDVRDRDRLSHAMHGIDVVIHAAALKRVDAVSYNPSEVIKTNVLGTMNVIEAAWANGVRKVVVVSSDKAVEPMNIYGMSKGLAEAYAIAANSYTAPSGTNVACVRYGNVLGSRGSVVEKWRQLSAQSSVKVADCTRFWLTMDTAVDFILKVVDKMNSGWIYVPKLRAASIATLAESMGLKVSGEEQLRVGGEKRHEKLLSTDELNRIYDFGFAYGVKPALSSWDGYQVPEQWKRELKEYSSETVEQLTVTELRSML
jgi:UDP-N-acetylglucosamine 4,6-dehydratase